MDSAEIVKQLRKLADRVQVMYGEMATQQVEWLAAERIEKLERALYDAQQANTALWGQIDSEREYVPEAWGALRKLMKESAAILALCEPQLREVAGHTNVNVFKLRIEEAGDLLGRISPETTK